MEQRLTVHKAALAALVEQAYKPADETTGTTMSGSVCRVCKWDSAPDFPEEHAPDCPLLRREER
jgi:hypothetical protein